MSPMFGYVWLCWAMLGYVRILSFVQRPGRFNFILPRLAMFGRACVWLCLAVCGCAQQYSAVFMCVCVWLCVAVSSISTTLFRPSTTNLATCRMCDRAVPLDERPSDCHECVACEAWGHVSPMFGMLGYV